jgi:glycosyltransferase involved in cell wall biosynthesis
MATVDVLVPTYNRSAMLRRCLESIQAQTYTDIRIIVGDDGVDSDTRTVAQDFCSRDGRFNYVHNSANLGQFGNVNALCTLVTAPYVHIMHDDDWLEPAFYERMVAEMEESPALALVWLTAIMFRGEKETTYGRFKCCLRRPRSRSCCMAILSSVLQRYFAHQYCARLARLPNT